LSVKLFIVILVRRKNGFSMLSAYLDPSAACWSFPVPGTSVGLDLTLGHLSSF
jgi:hypothetical protein